MIQNRGNCTNVVPTICTTHRPSTTRQIHRPGGLAILPTAHIHVDLPTRPNKACWQERGLLAGTKACSHDPTHKGDMRARICTAFLAAIASASVMHNNGSGKCTTNTSSYGRRPPRTLSGVHTMPYANTHLQAWPSQSTPQQSSSSARQTRASCARLAAASNRVKNRAPYSPIKFLNWGIAALNCCTAAADGTPTSDSGDRCRQSSDNWLNAVRCNRVSSSSGSACLDKTSCTKPVQQANAGHNTGLLRPQSSTL